jgi:hypothetical protein
MRIGLEPTLPVQAGVLSDEPRIVVDCARFELATSTLPELRSPK